MHRLSKNGFAWGIALNGTAIQRLAAKRGIAQFQIFRLHALPQFMVLHDQLLQLLPLLDTLLRQE